MYHGRDFVGWAKRDNCLKPEAVLISKLDDCTVHACAYFGISGHESTGVEHNFTVYAKKLTVLVAILEVAKKATTMSRQLLAVTLVC